MHWIFDKYVKELHYEVLVFIRDECRETTTNVGVVISSFGKLAGDWQNRALKGLYYLFSSNKLCE